MPLDKSQHPNKNTGFRRNETFSEWIKIGGTDVDIDLFGEVALEEFNTSGFFHIYFFYLSGILQCVNFVRLYKI